MTPATFMASKNASRIEGALRFDPKVNTTSRGGRVANMIVNVPTGRGDSTSQIRCVMWEEDAGEIPELHEGDYVRIFGKLKSRSYEKDGTRVEVTELNIEEIELVKHKSVGASPRKPAPPPQRQPPPQHQRQPEPPDDDLPF